MVPALTAFDFLDGSFLLAERARRRGVMLLTLTGVAAVAATLLWAMFNVQHSRTLADLGVASSQVSRLSIELGQVSNTGGLGEQQLAARAELLGSQLDLAAAEQVDALVVINDVRARLPLGATITSVQLRRDDAAAQRVTVQVAAESYRVLPEVTEAFASIWYLTEVTVTWTSGESRVAATYTATVSPELVSGAASRIEEQVAGVGSAPAPSPEGGGGVQDVQGLGG